MCKALNITLVWTKEYSFSCTLSVQYSLLVPKLTTQVLTITIINFCCLVPPVMIEIMNQSMRWQNRTRAGNGKQLIYLEWPSLVLIPLPSPICSNRHGTGTLYVVNLFKIMMQQSITLSDVLYTVYCSTFAAPRTGHPNHNYSIVYTCAHNQQISCTVSLLVILHASLGKILNSAN